MASLLPTEARDAHATTSAVAGASAAATRLPNKLTLKKLAGASCLEPTHEAPVKDANHRPRLEQSALKPARRQEGVDLCLARRTPCDQSRNPRRTLRTAWPFSAV